MPHARNAHHPRNASKATNTPAANSTHPSHRDRAKPNPAPTSNANALKPRTSRPLLPMLWEKMDLIVWFSFAVCAVHPALNRSAAGL
jgi:hypothetical protein